MLIGFENAVTVGKLRELALNLGLVTKITEKQKEDFASLDVVIYTPQGVVLDGKETDTMSFSVGAELQGNRKAVTHFLIRQAATYLTQIAPQIKEGVVHS